MLLELPCELESAPRRNSEMQRSSEVSVSTRMEAGGAVLKSIAKCNRKSSSSLSMRVAAGGELEDELLQQFC